jgi:hypothetical protein
MSEEVEKARRPKGDVTGRNGEVFKIDGEDSQSTSPRRVFKVDTEEDDDILNEIMSAGLSSDRPKLSIRSNASDADESGDEKVKKKLANIMF